MREGTFTFYTVQARTTHRSPWCKPKEPLEKIPDEDSQWFYASWDTFGHAAEPWAGPGNDYKPVYPASHAETHACWACTGSHGWWSLEYALLGLQRLRAASTAGKFDYRDGYNVVCQAVRHEFRLVLITLSKGTRIVDEATVRAVLTPKRRKRTRRGPPRATYTVLRTIAAREGRTGVAALLVKQATGLADTTVERAIRWLLRRQLIRRRTPGTSLYKATQEGKAALAAYVQLGPG